MHVPFAPDDLVLAWPAWLLALLLLPFLAWWRSRHGRTPAVRFSGTALLRGLGAPARSALGSVLFGLVLTSLTFAVWSLARPQWQVTYDEEKTEGIAIMLAVDVSLSMRIQDFYINGLPVNRLTAAKRVMADFIEGRPNDRIGIAAFAGAPYLPCPLTLDHDWLQANIERVQTGVMEDGTAIGSGLAAAARRLDAQKVPSKVIILLTDGANNSGKLSPQDAARLAATLGIKIYTIAIGTPGVHMIPLEDGRIITSGRQEFDEKTLQEVAAIGNGQFYMAQDLNSLEKIFKTIDTLEKAEIKRKTYIEVSELYHWPAAAALGFLLLSLLLHQTVLRTSPAPAAV